MFPETNIEMLDWRLEQQTRWRAETREGKDCCGDSCTESGFCERYLGQMCVDVWKAKQLIEGNKDGITIGQ